MRIKLGARGDIIFKICCGSTFRMYLWPVIHLDIDEVLEDVWLTFGFACFIFVIYYHYGSDSNKLY